jgi:tRNA(Ile)-lysidine synthase
LHLLLPADVFHYGLLAAVSGGADSTAMLHALAGLCPCGGKIAVAHVNHGLRGIESDGDAEFVRRTAEEYRFPYFEHIVTKNPDGSFSENSLRKIRYQFLIRKTEEAGFRFAATAHTADDQTETVLLRILRGTGLEGLSGIPQIRQVSHAVTLIRPMLSLRRKEILEFLNASGKTFRQDHSNGDCRFTRNRIRNQLLPVLRETFNPRIDAAVVRLSVLAGDNETVLSELFSGIIETVTERQTEKETVLNVAGLRVFSVPVCRAIFVRIWKKQGFPLLEMDYDQWSRLAELVFSDGGCFAFPGGISAECGGGKIRLFTG